MWSYLENTYSVIFHLFLYQDGDHVEVTESSARDYGDLNHGTCLCSMLAYLLDGIETEIYVFEITEEYEGDAIPQPYRVLSALNKIDSFNMAGSIEFKVVSMSFEIPYNTNIHDKITYLTETYDTLFFASSGNANYDSSARNKVYPSWYSEVFGVGGIIFKDETTFGPRMTIARGATYASMYYEHTYLKKSTPVVVAPGEKIEAINDATEGGIIEAVIVSGTSLSSPILAAVTLIMCILQDELDSGARFDRNDLYACIALNSECDNRIFTNDITLKPGDDNYMHHEYRIGWGGVDFYDYVLWAYNYFKPSSGGGGGGGGGGSFR